METLIVNKATKEDLELLISIAKRMGIDIQRVPKEKKAKRSEKETDEIIMELSKKVNRAIHRKYVKPVLNDNHNGQ